VTGVFDENKEKLEKGCKKMEIMGLVKEKLPSADGKTLKEVFDKLYAEKGYKDVRDEPKKAPAEKKKE
jgi:hypothetical protein